jgi:putative Mn2+ efflux pump MntP
MNKKYIPWIIAGVLVLGIGTYFIVRKVRRTSKNPQKNSREIVLKLPKYQPKRLK